MSTEHHKRRGGKMHRTENMRRAYEALPDWLRDKVPSVEEHKEGLAEAMDAGPCPYRVCNGSGEIPSLMSIDGLSSKGLRRCRCLLDKRQREAYDVLMREGSMEAYSHMTFQSSTRHPHQLDAFKLLQGDPDGFYLCGPVGVGKTRLLACLVNQEIAHGRSAALITVPQLLAAAHEVKGAISDLERQACKVPYLALDDIGKEKLEGFRASEAKNMLFRLMDARSLLYERGLGFTSFSSQWPRDIVPGTPSLGNSNIEGVAPPVDQAVVSRIRGMTIKVFLNGPDLRAGR
jgi:DNA replication protein DnaC